MLPLRGAVRQSAKKGGGDSPDSVGCARHRLLAPHSIYSKHPLQSLHLHRAVWLRNTACIAPLECHSNLVRKARAG